MKGRAIALALCLAVLSTGCATQRLYVMWYADLLIHRNNPKVLIFTGNASTGEMGPTRWGRMCDVADCSMPATKAGAGLVEATPAACYSRWHKECATATDPYGKRCTQKWWDACVAKEKGK